MAYSVELISIALAVRDHGYGASVSCDVTVYSLAFADTKCAYLVSK